MAKARLKVVSNEIEDTSANSVVATNDTVPAKAERKKRTLKVVENDKKEEPKPEAVKPPEETVEVKQEDTEKKEEPTIHRGPTSPNNILTAIMAFKTIYVLCTLNKKTNRLTATHYAMCLVSGRNPTWGVFSIQGNLKRLRNSKEEVARDYPRLVWRRKMSEFRLENTSDLDVKKRRELIEGLVEAS